MKIGTVKCLLDVLPYLYICAILIILCLENDRNILLCNFQCIANWRSESDVLFRAWQYMCPHFPYLFPIQVMFVHIMLFT